MENNPVQDIDVPEELKDMKAWLCWKYVPNKNPKKKPKKVPYYADGSVREGAHGTVLDRSKLVTFDELKRLTRHKYFDGINLACFKENGIFVFDYDNVESQIESLKMVHRKTYWELSPSGTGFHAVYFGNVRDQRGDNVEVFCESGTISFTGNGNDKDILEAAQKTYDYYELTFGKARTETDFDPLQNLDKDNLTESQIKRLIAHIPPDCSRGEWLNVAYAIHFELDGEGFEIWDNWSSDGDKYDGSEILERDWSKFKTPTDRKAIKGATLIEISKRYQALNVESVPELDVVEEVIQLDGADEDEEFITLPSGIKIPTQENLKFKSECATKEFSKGPYGTWFIDGLLSDGPVNVLYGHSGAGKSFFVLSMIAALLTGSDFHGRRTEKIKVMYVAAEGGSGARLRVLALQQSMGVDFDDYGFKCIDDAVNLSSENDVVQLIGNIYHDGGYDLIVFDTLAQCTSGANLNDSKEVTSIVDNLKIIHKNTKASCLLVAHTGKDRGRGMKGDKGFYDVSDSVLECYRPSDESNDRELISVKQREGQDKATTNFTLKTHNTGVIDQFGNEKITMICSEVEMHSESEEEKVTPEEKETLQILSTMIINGDGVCENAIVETLKDVVGEKPIEGRDRRRQSAKRLFDKTMGLECCMYEKREGKVFSIF